MVARIIVALIGFLYVALAVWCTARPEATSSKVGFDLRPGSGQSEFLVIYGGLELALGLFLMAPLFKQDLIFSALLLCLLVHLCLVAFRMVSFLLYDQIDPFTYKLAVGEWVILIATGALFAYQVAFKASEAT